MNIYSKQPKPTTTKQKTQQYLIQTPPVREILLNASSWHFF